MRIALAAALLASASPALAAPLHGYAGVVIAPKGDVIADMESAGDHAAIVVRSAKTGKILRTIDPCAKCMYAGLTFSSDGAIAFLARDRAAGSEQLMVAEGAKSRVVATIPGIAQTPRFSPDGKRIALLVTLGAAKESGATQAGVRQIGEIGEKNDEQRIAVFDAAGSIAAADVKPVSPADRYIYEYDWTPDGNGFVATSAIGNGDDNWWVATLDAIDARTGDVRQIAAPKTQINMPRVSPDGKTVAYIGGLMSDFGSIGGDLWTVPFAGGAPANQSAGDKATITSIAWTAGGIREVRLAGDKAQVAAYAPGAGARVIWERPSSFSAGDGRVAFSADGQSYAASVQDFEHAPALYVGGGARTAMQLTHDNDGLPAVVKAQSVTWKNDGFTVQGWLLAPANADPAKKAPMITIVHGGPAAANVPNYIARGASTALLDAGYYIFLPNPRGSYGQGEAFTAANRRDFGGGDLRDILTGIDAVEKVAPVDDKRLGLTGGSYGGFMSMWANTQTNRFKAIVAGAGLSNWISYYGTNGIDQWMLPYFGKTMYDDPKAYEDCSAIYFIKKAKTPTFIYVGERDIEVPPTQSVEYWHALKDMGVPTSLVIYPDEGHGIRNPEHSADVAKRTIAWFDKYLAPAN